MKMVIGFAAAALLASAASATQIDFGFSASGLFQGTSGTGNFTTSGDNGTFTLASGLTGFTANGDYGVLLAGGSYSFGVADLASFSTTLDNGIVTALAFETKRVQVPLTLFGYPLGSRALKAKVDGLGSGNLAVTTGRGVLATTFGGDLTLSAPAAVPEPASWAMMIAGFGMVGGALRGHRRTRVAFA